MNILYLCDEYPPVKTGGIGIVTKVVAEAMAWRGHGVYVVSGRPVGHGLAHEVVENGVTVFRLTYFKALYPLGLLPDKWKDKAILLLKKIGIMRILAEQAQRQSNQFVKILIREKLIDVVEKPDYTILSKYFSTPVKFASYGIPTVIRVHGALSFLSYYKTGIITSVQRQNDIDNYLSGDRICAVSNFSKEFVQQILGVKRDIDVIYNPLENSYIQLSCKTQQQSHNVVFVGKIIETKGAFSLIRAFNLIADKYPEIRLVMIGRGDVEKARTLLDERYRDRVDFTGYVVRKEVKQLITDSLFCVIPSYFENFSMAAMEVMACGKPLIYTERASGPELIRHKVNGMLVDPTNSEAISVAMSFLLDHPDACRTMGENALRTISESFSEEVIVDRLEAYYKQLIRE